MNTKLLRRIGIALGAIALSACQSTMLESLPTGTATACPPEWRGAWIALDADSGAHEDTGFVVAGDCTVTLVEEHEGKPRELVFTPRFASARGAQLVLFGHEDAAPLIAPQAPAKPGWYPFEWRRSDDVLVLRAPDHRRIATLVVNGALDGTVSWDDDDKFVFVTGDAAAITAALGDGRVSFGGGEGGARAARIGEGRRDLDRALARQKREHARAEASAGRSK
jgi:hypothetical protein